MSGRSSELIQGFVGLYVEEGGWVAARDALDAVGQELRRLDVKSAFGSTGTFAGLVLNNEGICTGVRTADGTIWDADVVVMATGAWSPSLIDLEGQCESKVSANICGADISAGNLAICSLIEMKCSLCAAARPCTVPRL